MRNAVALFAIVIMSLSCNHSGDARSVKIDAESTILIDVRTAEEYKAGHLRNAINIPHTEIGARIGDHAKSKEDSITLYCRSGRRSAIAKKTLENMGYKHVVDAGAYSKLREN